MPPKIKLDELTSFVIRLNGTKTQAEQMFNDPAWRNQEDPEAAAANWLIQDGERAKAARGGPGGHTAGVEEGFESDESGPNAAGPDFSAPMPELVEALKQ